MKKRFIKNSASVILHTLFLFILTNICLSQDIQPRAYSNIPKNINLFNCGYSYSYGNVVAGATSPIKDLNLKSSLISATYIRSFSLLKRLARIQFTVPFVFLGGDATVKGVPVTGTRTGFADAVIRFGWNYFGSKAMDLKEFSQTKESTVLGGSILVSLPTGQYYSEKLINLGSNRWGFKPEIGYSTRFGAWYLDAYSGIWFFTANTEYYTTNTLTQNPLWNIQTIVTYVFPNYIWIAAGLGYVYGGQSQLNGVTRDDLQNNKRIGLVLSMPLSKQHSVKIQFNQGIYTRVGGDFNVFSLAYTYLGI